MNRRGFLGSILAAAAAPAIVRAGSLMHIVTPRPFYVVERLFGPGGDFTLDGWLGPEAGQSEYSFATITRETGQIRGYLDGVSVRHNHPYLVTLMDEADQWKRLHQYPTLIHELRFTDGLAHNGALI